MEQQVMEEREYWKQKVEELTQACHRMEMTVAQQQASQINFASNAATSSTHMGDAPPPGRPGGTSCQRTTGGDGPPMPPSGTSAAVDFMVGRPPGFGNGGGGDDDDDVYGNEHSSRRRHQKKGSRINLFAATSSSGVGSRQLCVR